MIAADNLPSTPEMGDKADSKDVTVVERKPPKRELKRRKSLEDRLVELRAKMKASEVPENQSATVPQPSETKQMSMETHFTPSEIAEAWHMDTSTVIEIFRHEKGVLKLDRPETRKKRGYCSFYIPASVAERVHFRMRVK